MEPHHKNPIFRGISPEEYEEMLSYQCTAVAEYEKGSVIFQRGTNTSRFGILLSGKIYIETMDLWGNRMILHNLSPGHSFAETYAFCRVPMMVDVTAVEHCQVLFIDLDRLLADTNREKSWYTKILYNLLLLSSQKNLAWSQRVFCISSKGIRSRVMNYLSSEALQQGTTRITIPFNRQQMADYLNVERSALSKELGRMQKEGILTFSKNTFCLLTPLEEKEAEIPFISAKD